MDLKSASGNYISADMLLDPSNGVAYAIVLPTLALFALGQRRWAMLYGCGAAIFVALQASV
ncbi:MAG: hypothetical protein AAF713_10575 [Pseudomonadota bacterium]